MLLVNSYRIFFFNLQYFLGFDGSLWNYIKKFHRFFFCSRKMKRQLLTQLAEFINQEQPDLCCFVEIEDDKFFPEVQSMLTHYPKNMIQNKYHPTGFLKKLRGFRTRCNGFFAKEVSGVKTHYFSCGAKRLIHEIALPNEVTVFMAHFALNRDIRRRQFRDIARFIATKQRVILCGDFNIFDGFGELEELMAATGLRFLHMEKEPTYPRYKPKFTLSLFLGSPEIASLGVKVIRDLPISDHLPVMLDFVLQPQATAPCTAPST